MTQYNLTTTIKQGEVGKITNFTLRDSAGLVNLTAYTITMTLKKGSTVTVDGVSITKKNQTTSTGECYHTWNADTAIIATGNHKGNLKLVNGTTVLYWPVDKNDKRTYFEVEVQEPID